MKMKDIAEAERPREKMLSKGADALSDGELLAILLRGGTPDKSALDLARELLSQFGGRLSTLFNAQLWQLQNINGIGPCKAAQLQAACELGRRYLREASAGNGKPLVCARMVYDLMIPSLKGLDHEECWIVLLNARNCEMSRLRVSSGGGTSTTMDISQMIRLALEHKAAGVFLVHNHPTGNPIPSNADIRETERLRNGLEAVGLQLVDHVVVADNSFFSFEEGKLRKA